MEAKSEKLCNLAGTEFHDGKGDEAFLKTKRTVTSPTTKVKPDFAELTFFAVDSVSLAIIVSSLVVLALEVLTCLR